MGEVEAGDTGVPLALVALAGLAGLMVTLWLPAGQVGHESTAPLVIAAGGAMTPMEEDSQAAHATVVVTTEAPDEPALR